MNPVTFVQEAYQELRKSTWMPREQLTGATIVVVVISLLIAAYAGTIDMVLSTLLRALLGGS
ncbi:MAG: preprotein translocase subunit SecE [Elusimicrobia bacterium]|nr:preprotein translocase subunit SecE [Elusimicrobiota bacterium]